MSPGGSPRIQSSGGTRLVLRRSGWARALAIACFVLVAQPASALPSGFAEEPVASGWNAVVGITFDANGNLYAWEKAGRVWIVHPDGTRHPTPLIDLREEVGDWRDFGLIGFALDPDFLENGYVYLSYVVDRHHLLHFGTPSYDPAANEYFAATIGRITRYTANAADEFESVDYGSRLVLVGETKSTGFPMLHQSHGVGALVFGTDGTLLASCGDGASFETVDNGGSDGNAYGPQALADGIITAKENVGAFRAQLLSSLSGKILRIDPATGNGVPSNPHYDGAAPRSARSRVWSLGYRNPYRMTLRPGTGEHDPAAGNPGVLYVGDVGWDTWEDIDVVTGPAQNMGWPIFEGMTLVQGYFDAKTSNLDAPNPLHGTGGCNKPYFDFQDLLVQDDLSPSWPNPCNGAQQVPAAYRHMHRRPSIDYHHGSGPARTGSYAGNGDATTIDIGSASSPVIGRRIRRQRIDRRRVLHRSVLPGGVPGQVLPRRLRIELDPDAGVQRRSRAARRRAVHRLGPPSRGVRDRTALGRRLLRGLRESGDPAALRGRRRPAAPGPDQDVDPEMPRRPLERRGKPGERMGARR